MLRVVRRHAALLGRDGLCYWQASTFAHRARNQLVQGRARDVLKYAFARRRLQSFSIEACWILLKTSELSFSAGSPSSTPGNQRAHAR